MQSLFFWLAVLIFGASLAKLLEGLYAIRAVPSLAREVPPNASLGSNPPPRVSAIVPACNEARRPL